MQITPTTILGIVALFVMLVNFFITLSMRTQIKGGVIGKRWNVMTALVALFTLGYGILPFVGSLSPDALRLIVALIFLFGAIYVTITLRLILGIVNELMS
jgi:ABC-type phosphate transport system permease subunit